MKRLLLFIIVFLLFTACALFTKKTYQIIWPDNIEYMEVFSEMDMLWNDKRYSGSMSLKLDYPEILVIDVFGPFGDTVIHLEKVGDKFLWATKEETLTDENRFEEYFGIRLSDFIDDLAFKTYKKSGSVKGFIQRNGYSVSYSINSIGDNNICWTIKGGNMCINFVDARFIK